MYGYVYITTNLVNGKMYIGQKKSTKFLNEKYLGSGSLLRKAINKYGKENFKVEMICECFSKEELDEKEIYYISLYDAVNNCNFYNLTKGGESGLGGPKFKGHHHTDESKNKISESSSGENNGFYGKHHTDATKLKMREKAKYRKPVSEETRKKLSKVHKGVKFTDEHKRKISEAQKGCKGNNYGKHLSSDTKNKISSTVHNQVWMNDGARSYRINKELVDEYINKGFSLGRLSFKKSSTTKES
jgi:group I intron endonuclease